MQVTEGGKVRFSLPEHRLGVLVTAVSVVCNTLGREEVEPQVVDTFIGEEGGMIYCVVELPYWIVSPSISGYRLVAVCHHNESLMFEMGDESISRDFLNRTECDHCNTKRIRNTTYILKGEDGVFQIGSTCINEYTGKANADLILDACGKVHKALFGTEDEFTDYAFHGWTPLFVISGCVQIIREHGFVSSGQAYETGKTATKDRFISMFAKKDINPTDDDMAYAERALAWAVSLPDQATDNYLANVKAVASAHICTKSAIGTLASIPQAFQRAKAKAEANESSDYVGKVGESITVVGKLVFQNTFATAYGASTLYKFDVDGNVVCWWSTKDQRIDNGNMYKISGKVKSHEVYQNCRQTTLTRCKIG